ncbi:TonB family protein [Xylella fastidiosa subsp. fastidiosa]|jgi:protein TonB|uniref:TonB protein n=2 Tax=Xylella fastidiosa TaxID=2371 RepID=Q87FB8_XYLFT|nr:energy transducer TonB [Xylella fastidiosa]KAF0570982.1 cell envelope biogenesis protein TonB [Xylella fastidiosa subsp. fastidiosa Mus-1]AAO27917.1 TonB protein [Xylella fastidiosa Temecula1]ACB91467.1 TonB family protein [Xylella fastidiosa M23]EGO82726.1 Periplasmic protein [Xylella fastidiosa EB92.1]KGM21303.1 energy transducer TonB [Xylella fastidiosa]
MSEELIVHRYEQDDVSDALNWPRILGIAFVIALHLAAFMLLLIPAGSLKAPPEKQRLAAVTIVDSPPPPPPPPPPQEEKKPAPPIKTLAPPRPAPVPPPPQPPVVDVPQPRPSDVVVPPAPPAPPTPPSDISASVDISSKKMNPPKYPPTALRAGIQGEVVLIIDVDADGNVTNVSVEKSSRNRDLDRAAIDAASKWKFNPSVINGKKSAGRVRVPVNFSL